MKVNTKDNLKTCVAVDNLNDPHTHAGLSGAAEMDRADRSESGKHRSEDVAVTAQPWGSEGVSGAACQRKGAAGQFLEE